MRDFKPETNYISSNNNREISSLNNFYNSTRNQKVSNFSEEIEIKNKISPVRNIIEDYNFLNDKMKFENEQRLFNNNKYYNNLDNNSNNIKKCFYQNSEFEELSLNKESNVFKKDESYLKVSFNSPSSKIYLNQYTNITNSDENKNLKISTETFENNSDNYIMNYRKNRFNASPKTLDNEEKIVLDLKNEVNSVISKLFKNLTDENKQEKNEENSLNNFLIEEENAFKERNVVNYNIKEIAKKNAQSVIDEIFEKLTIIFH